jgi:hypothetical protein
VRASAIAALVLLAGCTGGVTIPREPFADIPVPREWIAYSTESAIIKSPKATAAKLIYFTETKVDPALDEARRLLVQAGWKETKSERFVNPEKFPGVWAEFTKGEDVCRVTAIEGAYATHVDYAVARVNP